MTVMVGNFAWSSGSMMHWREALQMVAAWRDHHHRRRSARDQPARHCHPAAPKGQNGWRNPPGRANQIHFVYGRGPHIQEAARVYCQRRQEGRHAVPRLSVQIKGAAPKQLRVCLCVCVGLCAIRTHTRAQSLLLSLSLSLSLALSRSLWTSLFLFTNNQAPPSLHTHARAFSPSLLSLRALPLSLLVCSFRSSAGTGSVRHNHRSV